MLAKRDSYDIGDFNSAILQAFNENLYADSPKLTLAEIREQYPVVIEKIPSPALRRVFEILIPKSDQIFFSLNHGIEWRDLQLWLEGMDSPFIDTQFKKFLQHGIFHTKPTRLLTVKDVLRYSPHLVKKITLFLDGESLDTHLIPLMRVSSKEWSSGLTSLVSFREQMIPSFIRTLELYSSETLEGQLSWMINMESNVSVSDSPIVDLTIVATQVITNEEINPCNGLILVVSRRDFRSELVSQMDELSSCITEYKVETMSGTMDIDTEAILRIRSINDADKTMLPEWLLISEMDGEGYPESATTWVIGLLKSLPDLPVNPQFKKTVHYVRKSESRLDFLNRTSELHPDEQRELDQQLRVLLGLQVFTEKELRQIMASAYNFLQSRGVPYSQGLFIISNKRNPEIMDQFLGLQVNPYLQSIYNVSTWRDALKIPAIASSLGIKSIEEEETEDGDTKLSQIRFSRGPPLYTEPTIE